VLEAVGVEARKYTPDNKSIFSFSVSLASTSSTSKGSIGDGGVGGFLNWGIVKEACSGFCTQENTNHGLNLRRKDNDGERFRRAEDSILHQESTPRTTITISGSLELTR
jgi:hypothetical protein